MSENISENVSEQSWETISIDDNINFHHTFLDILFGKDPLDIIYNNIKDHINFNFNFNILPKCCETVEKIAPYLLQSMKKEQELIDTNENYYVARDLVDNTVYICFKELMVIDIDGGFDVDKIIKHFSEPKELKEMTFRIYGRKNELNNFCSYHIFCTSKKMEYRNKDTISFMISNFCDFYYTVHTYIRGFCVRLNNKFKTQNKYEYICTLNADRVSEQGTITNSKEQENPELVELVKLHESLIEKYSKLDICYPKDDPKDDPNNIEYDPESKLELELESESE